LETYLDVWLAKGEAVVWLAKGEAVVWLAKGEAVVWFILGAIGLILAAWLLVKQFVADELIPLLVLHVNNVVCDSAFSVYVDIIAKATDITKAIPSIFEIPIVLLKFHWYISGFEIFIKSLVGKNI
jgi:hypothetical protein